jgi:hypothetical protein
MIKDRDWLLTECCNDRVEAHFLSWEADIREDDLVATEARGIRPGALIRRTDREVERSAR